MKKFLTTIIVTLLVLCTLTVFVACDEDSDDTPKTLSTPQNVEMSDSGLITWTSVENAQGYVVVLNGTEYQTSTASYQVAQSLLANDIKYSVYAIADGYENSQKSEEKLFEGKGVTPPLPKVTLTLGSASEVKSGKQITLVAYVDGEKATDGQVSWSISKGKNYASIDKNGTLTANEVDGDKEVTVVATSTENSACKVERVITVLARTTLTQEMLNALNKQKIGFEGYDKIDLYKTDMFSTYYSTTTLPIKTAMDGEHWYAEYESDTGLNTGIYYCNRDGVANQVSVSFMNEEQYVPMITEDSLGYVSWTDAGLYNSLTSLNADDFTFDEDLWRWMYSGNDTTLCKRIVSSATPYDFEMKEWGLIIDEGEILGIYAQSKDDYQIAEGFKAIQYLYLAINTSDSVDVPTIGKFTHDKEYDDLFNNLQTAIDNMRALESYTIDYYQVANSQYGQTTEGYIETVTSDLCYFVPYSITYDNKQNEVHTPIENSAYGYKKINDNFYNSFSQTGVDDDDNATYSANRAFTKSFDNAKASFAFSSEIFYAYYENEDEGTTTYYVREEMSGVASTFYRGVGTDSDLYGIFATKATIGSAEEFTPFVTIKDGYIQQACFYFYLGSMYGVSIVNYSDFDTATIPADVSVTFETRQVPASWSELTINASPSGSSTTTDDIEYNAVEYLKTFFGKDNIAELIPFFGDVLGDTYGFGLATTKIPGGSSVTKSAIVFYYDVPLDIDYTITSSMLAVREQLSEAGFVRNKYDEYHDEENGIWVAPVDSSLDFMIYVWKDSTTA